MIMIVVLILLLLLLLLQLLRLLLMIIAMIIIPLSTPRAGGGLRPGPEGQEGDRGADRHPIFYIDAFLLVIFQYFDII